ncbi:MAG: hypothetical protein J5542_09570 [Bacteroidales bacterium]|nr:hypothetical protein [Bacteroidales bacterium]
MKKSFIIFYSWQKSTLPKENKQKILNCLENAVGKLKNDEFEIIIDEDSRNTTREDSIDYIILQKIPNCDFFVGDITPVAKDDKGKPIPNPNVMLELGYAAKAIGWSRCLLVWNTKYGDLNQAPFDIRNRSIITYNSTSSNDIDFYGILKKKIEQYDQILLEQKNADIDYNVFQYWNNMISPQKLDDIVDKIITNCAYYTNDYDLLSRFHDAFNGQIANHYRNNLLENRIRELNESLNVFCCYLAGSEFDRVIDNYWKINYKYTQYDPIIESKIKNQVYHLGCDVLEKNKQYYEALQSVFGYLG